LAIGPEGGVDAGDRRGGLGKARADAGFGFGAIRVDASIKLTTTARSGAGAGAVLKMTSAKAPIMWAATEAPTATACSSGMPRVLMLRTRRRGLG
jgi:hypothetical protein